MASGLVVAWGKGAIGEEGLAGGFGDEYFMVAEEFVYDVAAFEGDEEEFAAAGAPDVEQVGVGEEDVRCVGEGGAEEHGGGSAFDEIDLLVEVEGDGGAVGLVPVEVDGGVGSDGAGGLELLDFGGDGLRGEHGAEADEGDVRGDEEDGGGESDGAGGGEVVAFGAEEPGDGGAKGKGEGGKGGGESERGEAGAGEIEEVRHGEGVVAYAAVGEEVADVGDEGEVAGGPEAKEERDGDGKADDGEGGVGDGDPAAGGAVFRVGGFGAGEGCGDEDEEWEVGGEGVVLLIGGDGEEDQDECGVEGEEQGGALSVGEGAEGFGKAGAMTADPTVEGDAWKRDEERPGEEPDEVKAPEEVSGELVVVHGEALAEETEEVLVDEVEPEEAVAMAEEGAVGVAEAGEDVPGSGDREEEGGSGEGFQLAEGAPLAGEGEVDDGGAEEEDERDEAFGEDGEGEGDPEEVGVSGGGEESCSRGRVVFEGMEEAVEGGAEEEG